MIFQNSDEKYAIEFFRIDKEKERIILEVLLNPFEDSDSFQYRQKSLPILKTYTETYLLIEFENKNLEVVEEFCNFLKSKLN